MCVGLDIQDRQPSSPEHVPETALCSLADIDHTADKPQRLALSGGEDDNKGVVTAEASDTTNLARGCRELRANPKATPLQTLLPLLWDSLVLWIP